MDQNEKNLRDKSSLKLFLIITLCISLVLEIVSIILKFVTGESNGILLVALMWTPGIVGIVFAIKNYKRVAMLGVTIGRATPILIGLFLPFVYLFLSYLISWIILGDKTIGFTSLAVTLGWRPESKDLPVFFILSHVVYGILPSCASAFGEELGWRGFMYPIMERVAGRKKAVLYNGLIFALWQLPLVIFDIYHVETVLWYGIIMFVIYQVLLGFILAWLRSISGSILPPLFIHASSNLFGQMVFEAIGTNDKVPYLAGSTGIITIAFMAITVFVAWKLWAKHDLKVQEKALAK